MNHITLRVYSIMYRITKNKKFRKAYTAKFNSILKSKGLN